MKRKYIVPITLLLSLAVSSLSLLSCNSNENDDIQSDSKDGECAISLNFSEIFDNTDTRSSSPETTKVFQQKINDDLILEAEVMKENAINSRATENQLFNVTRVVAIIYKKENFGEPIVYRSEELIVFNNNMNINLLVPSQDIIIDFYSLNTHWLASQPMEEVLWKPVAGTPRKDVKYTIDLDSNYDFLYGTVECTYPFNNLERIILKHPFPQIAIKMSSQEAGIVTNFSAELTSNSSYKKATVRIKDGDVTELDGTQQPITFVTSPGDNGGVSSYEDYTTSYSYGLSNLQSQYSIVIPIKSTTSHKVRVNSLLVEHQEMLQTPLTVDLDNSKLPLNAGTRYIINFTIKRPQLPEVDVPYIQFNNIQVATANLQYEYGKWFVGNSPSYMSPELANGGNDHYVWNTIYPYRWTPKYIATEWKASNDPCTKLGSTWHTPTKTEWNQLMSDNEGVEFSNYNSVHGLLIKGATGEIFLPLNGYMTYNKTELVVNNEYNSTAYYRLSDQELFASDTPVFRVSKNDNTYGLTTVAKEVGCAVRCVR